MMTAVFKFCSAAGGAAILRHQSLFISSPLDLNDPFEMRPAWTDAHEQRHREDRELRNKMMAGSPILLATESGLKPMGRMHRLEEEPTIPVDSHRGIADRHNGEVFRLLHERFRVLSFATGILEIGKSHAESTEESTLLWSHYADSFQGVCLAFDPTQFENGIKDGGFPVTYSPSREGLPPDFYDVYRRAFAGSPTAHYASPSEDPHWQAMVRFLTQKSPAWQYEQELRMIYDLADTSKRDKFDRRLTPCERCKSQQPTVDQCPNSTYRDVISVPPPAIRAVIFGTDVGTKETAEILRLLEMPEFSHVLVYWSSLHSEQYVLQYNLDTTKREDEQSYSMHMQRLMEKQIAMAKGHMFMGPQGLKYRPSKKGICFAKPGDGDCGTGA
jgi:hypothetical protein